MLKREIIYFDKPGPQNTEAVIEALSEHVETSNIEHIIVASTRGQTALKVVDALSDQNLSIICVAEHCGFAGNDRQLLSNENKKILEEKGASVLIGSHVLSGIERSLSKKFGGISHVETIAHTLRQFGGEGLKVAVEISIMAADAGLIPTDREVIAIGGSSSGADTAIVLKPAHMNNFYDLEIREIIAKPRQRE
jgi:hypothetical protein